MARAVSAAALLALGAAASPAQLWRDAAQPVDVRVSALLAAMTLEEKVAQLFYTYLPTADPASLVALFPLGTGALSNPNQGLDAAGTAAQRNAIQAAFVNASRLGIPLSFYGETMRSAAVLGATIFPSPAALGASWNASLLQAAGGVVAAEGAALWVWTAPCRPSCRWRWTRGGAACTRTSGRTRCWWPRWAQP
jgi:beta-glucosidase